MRRKHVFSDEFCVFLSEGARNEKHGVGVIIHRELLPSLLNVRAFSPEIIGIQLKITGGRLTLVGINCSHDGHDLAAREAFFETLFDVHTKYSGAGPMGYCGDLTSKITFRAILGHT